MRFMAVLTAAWLALGLGSAEAQVPEIRLARQYSMGYLQFNVMDHEKLIQKHAAALGIPEVKVTWLQFNGPSTMNDALISDSIDIVAGSPSGVLTIWGRTRGTAQEVRAISALVSLPFKLNTNDPEIRGIDDLGRCGKIAVPSIKVSSPAMTLQMAAARAYGMKEYARYDPLTVSMSPPDATIAMLTKQGGVNCVFGLPPFLQQQLQNPSIHPVLDSFDVAGGPNTYTTAYTTARFRDRSPVLFRALYAALEEATERVNADPRLASQYLDRGWRFETIARLRHRGGDRAARALDDGSGANHGLGGVHGLGRNTESQAHILEGLFLAGGARHGRQLSMNETELADAYDRVIVPFWNDNGRQLRFASALDGLPLAGMAFPQPSPTTAIVISSGRTESYIKYKELVYDLYQAGYSVYILDHRGQGLSGRMLSGDTRHDIGYVRDFADYAADLKQFYTQFVLPTGHRHYALLCHSMGGCIGSAYLETWPRDFACAVLSSPMHQPSTAPVPAWLAEILLDTLSLAGRGEEYAPGQRGYDANAPFADNQLTQSEIRWKLFRREFAENPAARLGGASVHWVKAALDAGEAAQARAGAIEVPVLLLQAGADSVVVPEAQQAFCDRLNQARPGACRLERIPGAWHELFIATDVYRRPALELILGFIRRCVG